ncbi:hypothetical protein MXB_1138 [Myxobolus squamalis]|nr:hypothetical protein MXB_1138 [Myxobolus squamalis]
MNDGDSNLSFLSAIETINESLLLSNDNPIFKIFENLIVSPIRDSVVVFCGLSALVNCGVDLSKIYFYLSKIIALQSYDFQNSEESYWYGINKNRLSIHHIQEQLNVL